MRIPVGNDAQTADAPGEMATCVQCGAPTIFPTYGRCAQCYARLEQGDAPPPTAPRRGRPPSVLPIVPPSDAPVTAEEARGERARLGLSKAAMGQLLGVDEVTVARWEQGTSLPQHARLWRWALRGVDAARAAS